MSDLFLKNLEWLNRNSSAELAAILAQYEASSEPVGSLADNTLNLKDKKTNNLLYTHGLIPKIKQEIDDYFENPIRYFSPVDFFEKEIRADDIPDWSSEGRNIHDIFIQKTAKFLPRADSFQQAQNVGGYLITFGLGLGAQIFLYLQRINVKNLIIVEPKLDFLQASMKSIDWSLIGSEIEKRGGTIEFIVEQNPVIAGHKALHSMRGTDFDLIDGSYITRHYDSDAISVTFDTFHSNITILSKGLGFFEDEVLMYKNCLTNLNKKQWYQLPSFLPQIDKSMPAFIIGSGPSLDYSIETIKKFKNKAIIYSSGTALTALLQNDIIPDFHCETENTYQTVEVHKQLPLDQLKKIKLIATNTVQPESVNLFEDVIYCIRDSVSPTRLFFNSADEVHAAAANVSCLAIRTAISFGQQDIYMFGTDFGTKQKKSHHSKSSIYNTKDDKFYKRGFNMPDMDIKIPAQRGGKAYTNVLFKYALQFVELLTTDFASNHRFYNTADGALIENTRTIKPSKIRLNNIETDKHTFLKHVLSAIPTKNSAEIIPTEKTESFKKGLLFQLKTIKQLSSDDENMSYEQLYAFLKSQLLKGHGDRGRGLEPAIRTFSSGTFLFILQRLDWIHKRTTEDELAKYWPDLRATIHDLSDMMLTQANEMFDALNQLPPSSS